MLREKAQKIAKDEHTLKLMEARNSDLTRRVRDLEDLLQQKTNSSRSGSGLSAAHSSTTNGTSANSNSVSMNGGLNGNSVELQRLKDQVADLNKKLEAKVGVSFVIVRSTLYMCCCDVRIHPCVRDVYVIVT